MLRLAVFDAAIVAALFAVSWAMCVRIKNYGFLDVTWTLSIGVLALIDGVAGPGDLSRRSIYTIVALAWSLRLGLFILRRVARHHPKEDVRYRSLRETWKSPTAFLAFFELQALIALIFSAPFLAAAFAMNDALSGLEIAGLSLAAVGIAGESVADWQAAAFKNAAGGAKKVLDAGLWRYSRHPNYFFEIVVWVGFALASLALPHGSAALACPVLISYFLLRVTGIPLTEKHSVESHGEAYRAYQRTTSPLIPLPKRGA